jgi:hypothetical protein
MTDILFWVFSKFHAWLEPKYIPCDVNIKSLL